MEHQMTSLIEYTKKTVQSVGASAAALYVIQDGEILTEWYAGSHHHKIGARSVTADSMFNIYSVRKTYVGLATALAILEAEIDIHTLVSDVVNEIPKSVLGDLSFWNLATKTNSKYFGSGKIEREEIACMAIKEMTGMNISDYLRSRVFEEMHFKNTEWATVPRAELVCDFEAKDGYASIRLESNEGHERNLYTTAKELARWGQLHLNKGLVNGKQIISNDFFNLIDQLREDTNEQHRILGWYYEKDWIYATGWAGCHCVIIPQLRAVGVRMLNKYTSNYAEDQQRFNQILFDCLNNR